MNHHRFLATASALACALAVAGCGLGPGSTVGEVELTVTRDYGSQQVLRRSRSEASESETAMRLLDRKAEIATRYGGGFVQSIEGIEGGLEGGRSHDWFFFVNGVESAVGAADYTLGAGDRVWWDHRDWAAAMRVPAVVGSFPQPLAGGSDGRRHPLQLLCMGGGGACGIARRRLAAAGAGVAGQEQEAEQPGGPEPIRVLVGPWQRLRSDDAAALIEEGPSASGVFADFVRSGGAWRLQRLDPTAAAAGEPLAAGLIAATRSGEDPPTWIVTGTGPSQVVAAARSLRAGDLRDRYAVAFKQGRSLRVPAR